MPKRKLPAFQTLWNSYPTERSPCRDQNRSGELLWGNQCAIRVSTALVDAGFRLTGYTDPKCSHGHARGAESLANYIWQQVGRPQTANTAEAARRMVSQGVPGLIFFRNLDGFRGGEGDHIDLWDCTTTKTGDYFESCREVWYWGIS